MELRELRPGLWHWTARHPDWTPDQGGADGWDGDVGSYAHVAPGGELLLLDPLVPEQGWSAIDGLVERHGAPQVLLTLHWHARSAAAVLDRYDGARVWAHAAAADEVGKRTPVTDTFAPGDELPGSVEAIAADVHDEVELWLPSVRGLVVGDAVAAASGGPVRLWQGGDVTRRALRPVLERPLELLLLTHGEPVLDGARETLASALAA